MPAENEIKYILSFDITPEDLEKAGWKHVPIAQAYLPDGPRVRQYGDDFVFTYKRWIEEKNRDTEIETPLSEEDFNDLWAECDEVVVKDRYNCPANPDGYEWSIDFLRNPDTNEIYFVLAEVEMPEGLDDPAEILDIIKPFIAYKVPKGDYDFANKRLSDIEHANALLIRLGVQQPSLPDQQP